MVSDFLRAQLCAQVTWAHGAPVCLPLLPGLGVDLQLRVSGDRIKPSGRRAERGAFPQTAPPKGPEGRERACDTK